MLGNGLVQLKLRNFKYRLVQAKERFFPFFFCLFVFVFVFFFSVFCNAKLVNPSKFYVPNDAKWVKVPLFLMGFSLSLSFKVCGVLTEN